MSPSMHQRELEALAREATRNQRSFETSVEALVKEAKAEALREVRTKIEGAMTALDAYTDSHAETARTALRGCLRVVDRLAAEGGAP